MAIASAANSSVALYVATAVFVLVLCLRMLKKKKWGAQLPPGPFGLPLLGNLPFLSPDLHRCFAELSRTYGPVMTVRLGYRLCIVLSSASAAREALKDNDLAFASHDVPAAATSVCSNSMGLNPYGPVWRMLRKVSIRDLLCAHSLEDVRPLREREVRRMLSSLCAKQGNPTVIRKTVFLAALNVMTSMLWGGTVDDEGIGNEFWQAMDGFVDGLGKANISDFFPALARFDLQGVARELVRNTTWYYRIFEEIAEERRKKMADGGVVDARRDFLQVVLELMDRGGDTRTPLTMDNVKGLFLDLVVGGTDTTSTTVEWGMAELLNSPETMKKLRDEIDAVVGTTRPVEESDIQKLPYLAAVMKEIFRLHPAAPILFPYSTSSSVTLGGFDIPKGTKVIVNAWAIHRDPSVWADPLRFDPERFLSGINMYDYGGTNYNYLPFGSGRRICVGISLAEKMVAHLLASLVHSFEWQLPEGTNEVHLTDNFGMTLKMEKPLVAIPSARLGKPGYFGRKMDLLPTF